MDGRLVTGPNPASSRPADALCLPSGEEACVGFQFSSEVKTKILGRTGDFVNTKIPDDESGEVQANIRQSVRESFVRGFRLVAFLAAALAMASALVSWLWIRGASYRGIHSTWTGAAQ